MTDTHTHVQVTRKNQTAETDTDYSRL